MPIFVTEPGRPQPTRLPEAARGQSIGVVDELNESQPIHESRNEPVDPTRSRQQQAAVNRAMAEYGEQAQSDSDPAGSYLPVSRIASGTVFSLPAGATLVEGLKEMQRHDVHHLVITSENTVVGLVDNRWILNWLYQHRDDERLVRFAGVELPAFLTATPETDAHQLARLMLAHQLSAALVIGPENFPRGIVTNTDFLRLYAENSVQEGNV
ncbi:CBS domain-containing protein [Marinobacter halodurans]|uniref:CBS domain-containing protein n=1 Tax=Marinobacter halodurans TaxID=2528979 RepID=A0ABY1ZPY1_9GAMM|nr:CBS domain-containing protein [Marinobacter halodurans]TBW59012.1 CBS domain-containing protein [Marinobacter halodurans]